MKNIHERQGFALVLALSLMGFILLLVLSLPALLNVEIVLATQQNKLSEARQNALLALNVALGELQQEMGPDQRVSATALVVADVHEDWEMLTGVWDADPESGTYGNRLKWLVSGGDALDVGAPAPVDATLLVGAWSGRASVKAPLVTVEADGRLIGHFAWWVADEGSKASVALNASGLPEGDPERWRAAWRYAPERMDGMQPLEDSSDWEQVISRDQFAQRNADHDVSPNVTRDHFHDYTLRADAVLSNVRDGGLKRDLTVGLQSGRTDMEEETGSLMIFPPQWSNGTDRDPGGPLWEQLRSFYNTRVTADSGNGTIDFRRGNNETQAIIPVLTHTQLYGHVKPLDVNGDFFRFYIIPTFVIWNPYQHALKMPDFWVTLRINHSSNKVTWSLRREGSGSTDPSISMDVSTLSWKIPATTWQAGESKLFCMHEHRPLPASVGNNEDDVTLSEGWLPGYGNYVDMGETGKGMLAGSIGGGIEMSTTSINGFHVYLGTSPGAYSASGAQEDHSDVFASVLSLEGTVSSDVRTTTIPSPQLVSADINEPLVSSPGEGVPSIGWRSVMKFAQMTGLNMTYIPGRSSSYNPQLPIETLFLGHYNPRAVMSGLLPDSARYPYWTNPLWASEFRPGYSAPSQYDSTGNYAAGYASSLPSAQQPAYFEFLRRNEEVVSIGRLMHAGFHRQKYRHPYDNYQPAFPIGNSLVDPRIPSDAVYRRWEDIGVNSSTQYDMSYLLNAALWDRYFFSAIRNDDTSDEQVKSSRNPRLYRVDSGEEEELSGYDTSARYLMVKGGFNVNSPSVEAWKALLASFWGEDVRTGAGLNDGDGYSSYARYHEPIAGAWQDGEDELSEETHAGFRRLNASEIDDLARAIVDVWQERTRAQGRPYLSLSEYVNRSLRSPIGKHRQKGLLQEAIDRTAINDDIAVPLEIVSLNAAFKGLVELRDGKPTGLIAEQAEGDLLFGVPGYLTQADLLSALGHVLSPRSDTFLIRAYGDSVNSVTGKPVAKAWCEAEVQRVVEPVDGTDVDKAPGGRKFVIRSFRWLEEAEL